MNNIYAIIFDLDGVICSTDWYHYLAWKSLADRLGIYFDEEINRQLRGVSRMKSLEIVLGTHKPSPVPEFRRGVKELLCQTLAGTQTMADIIRGTIKTPQE